MMTSGQIEQCVQDIVVKWLQDLAGPGAPQIDTNQTFAQIPLTMGAYNTMCDDATASINAACNSNIVLSGAWRVDHYNKSIAVFIADAAAMVPATPGT